MHGASDLMVSHDILRATGIGRLGGRLGADCEEQDGKRSMVCWCGGVSRIVVAVWRNCGGGPWLDAEKSDGGAGGCRAANVIPSAHLSPPRERHAGLTKTGYIISNTKLQ